MMRRRLLMRASIQKQVDVQSIYDSMVLWYDIKRQNATNENMATRPILRDLSNNGHDATCYNFAWSKMSGIGGYSIPLKRNNYNDNILNQTSATYFDATVSMSGNTSWKGLILHSVVKEFTGGKTLWDDSINTSGSDFIIDADIKITGIDANKSKGITGIGLFADPKNWSYDNYVLDVTADGTYHVNVTYPTDVVASNHYMVYFYLLVEEGVTVPVGDLNIKIEILPKYPNALVSDGVDDYCLVDELPILTDYTIVAKRTDLSVIPDTVLASKRKQGVGTGDVSGAFQLERHFASNWTAFNFGSQNTINKSTDDIIYQTKSNYCGQNLSIGTAQDSDTMTLFKWNELSTVCANIALYSIILFNRTLTTEEIEWVKTNLINNSPLFNIYSFYAANVTTQITYAVNDTLVINTTGEQGTWLIRGDTNLLKTSFNITCDRPMYLAIADTSTDGSTVNKQKKYFDLQVGLNTVPAISDEELSQYNTLVICRPLDDAAGEYTIKAL